MCQPDVGRQYPEEVHEQTSETSETFLPLKWMAQIAHQVQTPSLSIRDELVPPRMQVKEHQLEGMFHQLNPPLVQLLKQMALSVYVGILQIPCSFGNNSI